MENVSEDDRAAVSSLVESTLSQFDDKPTNVVLSSLLWSTSATMMSYPPGDRQHVFDLFFIHLKTILFNDDNGVRQ